jgi:hypothetical protein
MKDYKQLNLLLIMAIICKFSTDNDIISSLQNTALKDNFYGGSVGALSTTIQILYDGSFFSFG